MTREGGESDVNRTVMTSHTIASGFLDILKGILSCFKSQKTMPSAYLTHNSTYSVQVDPFKTNAPI
jgi:hypothetical protein